MDPARRAMRDFVRNPPAPIRHCPHCGAFAVVLLSEELLAQQPDDTTFVCHPRLGGCNQGFDVELPDGAATH